MTVMLRRPIGASDLLGFRAFDRVFDEAFPWSNGGPTSWVPATDITEGEQGLSLTLDLPGVDPKDVKISLEHRVLTIRGEKVRKSEDKGEQVYRYERTFGSFERTFTLPDTLEADKVQASYENGVLTVFLPKAEKAKPREIPVAVK
ncbi:MAG TPA: Hsp20/alpha crystallin family protein [Gemmatimonadales bacterium]|nr:Hsp20/alpha crystallin family protein [Gemmatimonadales bacterium]